MEKLIIDRYSYEYNFVSKGFQKFAEHYYRQNKRHVDIKTMFSLINQLKKNYEFLNKYDSNFFENPIILNFNSIRKKDNLESNTDNTFYVFKKFTIDQENSLIIVPFLGSFKYYNSLKIKEKITSIFFKKINNNWFLYFNFKKEKNEYKIDLQKCVGIDIGLKEFAILSNNKKIVNPRYYRELEEKLSIEYKKLSKKEYKSKNYYKQLEKVNKINKKISEFRNNFLHKVSSHIVNNFDIIGIEKLSIETMIKNKKFSKSILDAGWGTFIKMLKYKAEEKGKVIIEVDRFYPSSQLCSKCGSRKIMPVHLRVFECDDCKLKIDRDYNASLNIKNKALEIYCK